MLEKHFDPAQIEAEHYKNWEESGAFKCDPESKADPYVIMMPPPNVTGSLHMGHALTFTLQDVLVRFNRMLGKDTLWQPGTDHAGIATQMVVERQLDGEGTSRHDLGRDKFIDRVWDWKEQSGGTITQQLRRLGASPDWERERFTMDEGLNAAVRKVFVQLYKEKLIYKDQRLVNWDPKLQSAISDLEAEQKEVDGNLWHFRYPIDGEEGRFIVIATTRPETMLGDSAVAVHPEDERYQDIIGKFVKLPIVGRLIPIVGDEYADPETGTGAVKITPAHDFNDFEVGRRHNLEMINILDQHAKINENAPESYQGLDRYDARKKVVEEIEALGLLDKIEPHRHMVPHGDRSGVVIEPWLTEQWYCDAETLAKPALEAVETGKTTFHPKQWENTYYEWMRNIQPWCISRQLWWGHQIPAWYGEDGEVFVAETEEQAYADAKAHYGVEDVTLTRDPDVLDTWFSSGLWPFTTLGWPEKTPELEKYYPGNVLVTGFDIIFFWVARMMMFGIHFMGDVPFKDIYMHALVRDEHGKKMSKSKGNVIDPLDLIGEYGADALRFTLTAMAAQGRDIKLAKSRVEGYRNFATKLWNAARFCEMNECQIADGFDPKSVSMTLNRWIMSELAKAVAEVTRNLENYRYNDASNAAYQFVWGTFCDWYLEFSKPVFYGDNLEEKVETQSTAAWVLDQILTMLHPFMPFITEELWGKTNDHRETSLVSAAWPELSELIDGAASDELNDVINLITTIRALRSDVNVPVGAKVNVFVQGGSEALLQTIATHKASLLQMARLNEIAELSGAIPSGSVQGVIEGATLIMPVAEHMDLEKELSRLGSEKEKLEKAISQIEKKLSNENFVSRAPEEVVQEQHRRKEEALEKVEKLTMAIDRLKVA